MTDQPPQRSNLPPVVFLSRSELEAICLRHIASGVDLSLAFPARIGGTPAIGALAGYTEWGATRESEQLCVCWSWGVLQSSLVVLNPGALKANIQLMEGSVVVPLLLNRVYLYEWIESLPWRETVREVVSRDATHEPHDA